MRDKQFYEDELSDPERMQKSPDLVDLFSMASPGGIERQEKRGQTAFVNTESLPRKLRGVTKEQLTQLGFVCGEDIDDLFFRAQLPDGWKKQPTDHSMWSKIVDGQGRERASIFYKAAFYDRDAFMSLTNRYTYGNRPVGGWGNGNRDAAHEGYVTDGGADIFVTDPTGLSPSYEQTDAIRDIARTWLEARYPEFQSPLAYWE